MVGLEIRVHEITMEYLRQNPINRFNGQPITPEAFARAYQAFFRRILAAMKQS